MVQKVEWDSDFFGYNVGKIFLDEKDEFDSEKFREAKNDFKIIYIFSKKTISELREHLVEEKLNFKKKLDKKCLIKSSPIYFNSLIHSRKELFDLAIVSGTQSRYKLDINFDNNEFERLYEKWIDNSIQNLESKTKIIIYLLNHIIVGFTVFSIKDLNVNIELIAVDKKFRGKGIGSKLIKQVEEIAIDFNCETMDVNTQSINNDSIQLYIKNNFMCVNKTYIYHYWKQ
jgi:dTDP-4-amino-4,6-dideoxy-D-galactose acyltransferase